jgi:tRNA(Arg) A34 adenosine deaminase TadA
MTTNTHETFMRRAIEAARRGATAGNLAVGSVIVRDGEVIGTGCNTVRADGDPTAHAEIVAIRDACRRTGEAVLPGTTLYTSMEPCPMCLWAIRTADIGRLVLGARHADFDRPDLGDYSVERLVEMTGAPLALVTGVLHEACLELRPELVRAKR